MPDNRWQQIEEFYHEALKRAPATRAAYLDEVCTGDEELRRQVEALLAYDDSSDDFIEQPAFEMAAQAFVEEQMTFPSQLQAGQELGAYQLQELLGRGGMGEVYLAFDTRLQRKVAIKLLPARFTADADRVRRFAQEARAASSLNHPNILTIHEIGEVPTEAGNLHYIVTEYVAGETLRQRITGAPNKQIHLTEAVAVVTQIAEALAAAHEAGIVHRDIKPENVMVRPDGYIKVLDFGLAKLTEPTVPIRDPQAPTVASLTEAGMVMGTPRYMSPEQARGEKVDARTDIFSLGVMLYEMIVGRPPFTGETPSEVIAAILRDDPPPLADPPHELQRIVRKALRKERSERYQTATEMRADLNQCKQQLLSAEKSSVPTVGASIFSSTMALAGKLRHKRSVLFVLASIALIVAGIIYFSFFGRGAQAIDSLAVLPFVNVGANPETEYLSDGITDSLINGLSRLPKLKVMSRNSVFRYKGKETDAQQAGNTLGVRAVLTGKVTHLGDDLIVSVELVDTRDNSQIWGEQYNHKLSDLLVVQSELARDISQQLRLKLSNETQQRLAKRGTENPEAYELYLKARSRFYDLSPDGAQKSLDYFQRAIEKDPSYAQAYAGFAEAYAMATYVATVPAISSAEMRAKAKDAALMAVKLDDTLAETHTSLALIAMLQEWDWPTAEREFKRAIALNPNYVPALHWYSHYFIYLGRFDESLAVSQRALALDPLDVGMNFHLGFHYYNARQYEQATAALQKTLKINPNHALSRFMLGAVYEQQGQYQEAIAEMQKGRGLTGDDYVGALGHAYGVAGQRGEAEKLLAQLLEEGKHKYVSPFSIARIYEGLGQKDQAFAWLEKAYTEHDSNLTNLRAEPRSDRLRSDPRFADLLRRIGLPL